MRRFVRGLLACVLVLAALVLVAGGLFGAFVYDVALNAQSDKSRILPPSQSPADGQPAQRGADERWFDDAPKEDVFIQSGDGLRLHSHQLLAEPSSSTWSIACHGYNSKAEHMNWAARRFAGLGYNVLLPDARGHGQSQGEYIGMGWDDRLDLLGWIQYITARDPQAQIVLYGISMGGATVMMAAGEELPPNVRAIVEDCGYQGVYEELSWQLSQSLGISDFPAMQFVSAVTYLKTGFWIPDGNALPQLAQARVPILFIHGSEDRFVPSEMVHACYEAAAGEKALLLVEGAGHGGAASTLGKRKYWTEIERFLENYVD